LDKDQLSNNRLISNLSLISKIIERTVKVRLTDHLSSNNLLNPHQSAYCKHHSTETALLYIHDHLINAIGSQKLSICLCLLDLSAAFDTIDHDILITCPSSWFGIHGSVLNWFKSYLSSRAFRVKCDNYRTFPSHVPAFVESPKALSLVLYSSLCTHLSIVHSKLDYCNSLYCNIPKSQTNRLQVIQNSLARAVVKAPKFCHVTLGYSHISTLA